MSLNAVSSFKLLAGSHDTDASSTIITDYMSSRKLHNESQICGYHA